MDECQHEYEPMPKEVTRYIADGSIWEGEPNRIVPCLKCGIPIDRGRFHGTINVPDWYGVHGE